MGEDAYVGIVDDEEMLVRTYELLFARRHIPLSFIALDGTEAIEKFRDARPRPKVMIIDYLLPYTSGIEAMKEILLLEPDTKVLFVSADGDIRQEALDAGADVFLKKPISLRILIDATRALMDE
jgi:two-component system, chemotaxis family, chemotaxis protein CheY